MPVGGGSGVLGTGRLSAHIHSCTEGGWGCERRETLCRRMACNCLSCGRKKGVKKGGRKEMLFFSSFSYFKVYFEACFLSATTEREPIIGLM